MSYLEMLYKAQEFGTFVISEYYAFGKEPPAEDMAKLKAIRRKIYKLERKGGNNYDLCNWRYTSKFHTIYKASS